MIIRATVRTASVMKLADLRRRRGAASRSPRIRFGNDATSGVTESRLKRKFADR